MNRAFPPETIEPCDHCGRDLTLLITDDGLEANDQRDYVLDETDRGGDRIICCAGCRTAMGIGDERD
jgi:hypothetical protein